MNKIIESRTSFISDTFLCIAHRGASGYEPENTLASFRKALELGALWVEFDIRVAQGHPVVFHDATLTRMTGFRGVLEEQTLQRIRELLVANREHIPTLEEALGVLKGRAGAQIELKGPGSGAAVAQVLRSEIEHKWPKDMILVSSFFEEELLQFHSALPNIPVGVLGRELSPKLLALAQKVKAISIHLKHSKIDQQSVQQVHAAGHKLFAYTVNDLKDLQKMRTLGVDGVFTDFPDLALQALV